MYVVLIRVPTHDLPEIGEIRREVYPSRQAAEEAARRAMADGKDAVVLYPPPVRYVVGPDGIVTEIQRR
jgi:hypothetical protein